MQRRESTDRVEDHSKSRFTFKIANKSHSGDQRDISFLRVDSAEEKFQSEIEVPAFIAWALLLANVFSAAVVPCWLMGDVNAEALTRNSWRFLMVSTLLIPFVSYERRIANNSNDRPIAFLSLQTLKINFICSINQCLFVLVSVYASKFTSLTHVFCLIRLKHFAISLFKFKQSQKYHEFEIGGTILVVSGILCMLYDSISLPQVHGVYNQRYLTRQPVLRLLGDLLALFGSILSAFLNAKYQIPKNPRFSNLILYNFFLAFNLVSFGYFFGGSEFSFNPKFGVMGLFTHENFVNVFYVSIMLGLNLMMSSILIEQMFSKLIRDIASSFQMLLTSFLYHLLDLEITHSGYTSLGLGFLMPGMILIIGGQDLLKNEEFNVNYIMYRPNDNEPGPSKISRETEGKKIASQRVNIDELKFGKELDS